MTEMTETRPLMPSYFGQILDNGTESHITWLLIRNLMHASVHRFDSVIFGGAVRDFLLHSNASREFYKLSTLEKYDDPTIHPELSDRFLLPTDIDMFITYQQHYNFKLYLYKRGFYYKETKKIDLSYINPLKENKYSEKINITESLEKDIQININNSNNIKTFGNIDSEDSFKESKESDNIKNIIQDKHNLLGTLSYK
jgi:hypothetical protein